MPFIRQEFQACDLIRVMADAARFREPDPGLWSKVARSSLRERPEYWVEDKFSGEYLLCLHPHIREAGGQNSFLFFTHGQLIAIWMHAWQGDASIQKLPSELKEHRGAIESRFIEAVGIWGARASISMVPPKPKFVGDDKNFYIDM